MSDERPSIPREMLVSQLEWFSSGFPGPDGLIFRESIQEIRRLEIERDIALSALKTAIDNGLVVRRLDAYMYQVDGTDKYCAGCPEEVRIFDTFNEAWEYVIRKAATTVTTLNFG